jgi:hypothetical protein
MERGPGQPAAAFFFGAGRSGAVLVFPDFFDCVPAGFLDEGGGQRTRRRLWRLIRSISSMITTTHPYCTTNREIHPSLIHIHAKLINNTSSSRDHALHLDDTGIRIVNMNLLHIPPT